MPNVTENQFLLMAHPVFYFTSFLSPKDIAKLSVTNSKIRKMLGEDYVQQSQGCKSITVDSVLHSFIKVEDYLLATELMACNLLETDKQGQLAINIKKLHAANPRLIASVMKNNYFRNKLPKEQLLRVQHAGKVGCAIGILSGMILGAVLGALFVVGHWLVCIIKLVFSIPVFFLQCINELLFGRPLISFSTSMERLLCSISAMPFLAVIWSMAIGSRFGATFSPWRHFSALVAVIQEFTFGLLHGYSFYNYRDEAIDPWCLVAFSGETRIPLRMFEDYKKCLPKLTLADRAAMPAC